MHGFLTNLATGERAAWPCIRSGRTGCRLAAASAEKDRQNTTDLVREAVGYSGVFGDPLAIFGLPPECADHTLTEQRWHNGRSVALTRIWNQALHNEP